MRERCERAHLECVYESDSNGKGETTGGMLVLKTENGIARENHSGSKNRQRSRFECYLIRNQLNFVIGEQRLKSFMMHWGSMGN